MHVYLIISELFGKQKPTLTQNPTLDRMFLLVDEENSFLSYLIDVAQLSENWNLQCSLTMHVIISFNVLARSAIN